MIIEIIEDYLKIDLKKETRSHTDRFYPSSASTYINYGKYKKLEGSCLRASYYSCLGTEPEDNSNEKNIRELLGDYTERMLIDIFLEKNMLVDSAVRFELKDYNVHGKLDAIIKKDSKEYGVEIKSIGGNNSWTNNQIFGSIYNTPYPKFNHIFQTLIYCYAFRKTLKNGFILLYIRRDTGDMKEFLITIEQYDKKLYPCIDSKLDMRYTVDELLKRYKILNKYILKSEVPPKEYMDIYPMSEIESYYKLGIISKKQLEKYNVEPFGDFMCRFCEYKNKCKEDK